MPPPKSKLESQLQKDKLVNSYRELLQEFSSKDLRNVGNYNLGKLIGKGSFGKVYLATHKLTNGSKVVLKSSSREDANLAREIHHHRQFLHPHIARLYEVIVTENLVWLALEYCPGDELYNYLSCNGPMPLEKVQRIFTQLVGAVCYVHSKSCVHRDLKLENILLDKHENVKLCDFGFTREYEGKASYLQTFCGTVCYSAPEMLKGEKYAGEKVDVWSLGIILYALIAGELPFDDDDDQITKKRILTEEPKYNERFPEDAKSLISLLLSKRPLLRPTLSDVLNHSFLAEHSPQQQAILKLARPAPFSTPLERTTLERMRSAGVNIDQVIESVLAQRCDALAGWWALLIEKEERKEKRRERKRREREAEAKNLRRLSAASTRLERISAALVEVDEEGHSTKSPRSRGRRDRRSIPTPQIIVPDLPKLPETAIVSSPVSVLPSPPIEKDPSVRSGSSSRHRPVPPPKENRRSRTSTLHLSASQPDLSHPQSILRRHGTRRRHHPIISQLASIKHWLIESTKRAKSPHSKSFSHAPSLKFLTDKSSPPKNKEPASRPAQTTPTTTAFNRTQQTPIQMKRSSTASSLTPSNASYPGAARSGSLSHQPRPLSTASITHKRNSLSPSPLTPRNSYRRSSVGLRGRKSTSSSVSSIRSIHHAHSHSKTSSISSNSTNTVSTPIASARQTITRSPHPSVKVLPATPSSSTPFPSNIRLIRGGGPSTVAGSGHHKGAAYNAYNEAAPGSILSSPASGLVFARRKRSAFKGPSLATSAFPAASGPGTPGLPKSRENVIGTSAGAQTVGSGARKSQIIEEEEDEIPFDCDDEDIEEVDTFDTADEASGAFMDCRSSTDDAPTINTDPGPISPSDLDPRGSLEFGQVQNISVQPTKEPQLLPAADIHEPKYPPFHPTEQPAGAETTHPPRSSSLAEKPGSSGHGDDALQAATLNEAVSTADRPPTKDSTIITESKTTVGEE
ncbi:CAMK/CAMKL protein kinase, variant 2 [Blastomyces dermatitidis ER-3]|uniref:CAMK/CAMKL protein kinase n=2 Tax=Blastomyces TaxID=229219 RepID=A0A179UDY6_BLAGS|nr:CAMK/CAMKL protein kinase [Blastomyces gilchristii SLH14081]XP_031576687.1 CAMK/CAMKL protein kinase, variant 1 [Blastomyces gilchristii SLH14081]XP_031576688.1 CAMK/CAMKL protein kinase, variant 2 [Blastomyces gilchristii SLH14081]XP_045280607.1 CAMK/CAMKL protein kinase [Blastomyces dermatitidis ER-3]XP_045280608.1 CAMK/CAMKL protein kinase, variant 1 [Blastomyces dermatitidis ER-3]XP_045280609.1 CAMK/CAMKL protein kinase, variant 2 [Blastomyces dermatitidis ER-3]OAT00880.1 CAMK/CAMKL pr